MKKEIIDKWSNSVSKGEHINRFTDYTLNSIENKCLDGYYDYFIASITTDIKDKEKRYNEAREILSEFINILPSAKVICKIVAFRNNWFKELRELSTENDIFKIVTKFIMNEKMDLIEFSGDNEQIYVENEIEHMLNIIYYYSIGEKEKFDKLFTKYSSTDIIKTKDENFIDTLTSEELFQIIIAFSKDNDIRPLIERKADEILKRCTTDYDMFNCFTVICMKAFKILNLFYSFRPKAKKVIMEYRKVIRKCKQNDFK